MHENFEPMTTPLIRTAQVTRTYNIGSREVKALQGIDMSVDAGRLVSLRGRSGSGKTTLLNCIGGLDQPTSGDIWLNGQSLVDLSESEWASVRRKQIGFVFQSFSLLPGYSSAENIDLMLRLAGFTRRQRQTRVAEVLDLVGLTKWADHRPFELSGGQQQRVAIARAIASDPDLILADEPTGELDTTTSQSILELLRRIVEQQNTTILVATHDLTVDEFADAVYILQDGQVTEIKEKLAVDAELT